MIFITNLFHLTAGRYGASNSDVYPRTSCFRSFDVYPLTGEQSVICFLREQLAENKFVVERAEIECCDSRFDVKKLTRVWKI